MSVLSRLMRRWGNHSNCMQGLLHFSWACEGQPWLRFSRWNPPVGFRSHTFSLPTTEELAGWVSPTWQQIQDPIRCRYTNQNNLEFQLRADNVWIYRWRLLSSWLHPFFLRLNAMLRRDLPEDNASRCDQWAPVVMWTHLLGSQNNV